MATTTTTKVTKKSAAKKPAAKKTEAVKEQRAVLETLNDNIDNAQTFAKKVWFAGLGVFGRSVEEIQSRYSQANEDLQARYKKINEDGQKLVNDLVVRGEKVQDDAEELVKEGRANIEEQIELAKTRLTGFVSVIDIPARLQDMSDKLETLSKDLKKTA